MTKPIHTGAMIRDHIERHALVRTHIAKSIGIPNTTIYAYEKRSSIYTDTLLRLCHAMEHNFFQDIAAQLPASYSSAATNPDQLLLAQQAEEIKLLQHENKVLKEILIGRGNAQ